MKTINYGSHFINKLDLISVQKSLESKNISNGKYVGMFEKKIKSIIKSKYVLSCNSGTSALYLSFLSLNVNANDIVIVPSINFIAANNILKYLKAKVYLADVNEFTGQTTPELIEECIKRNKLKKIKAILIMFNGGYPRNINGFYNLKKKYKTYLIEDACHAFGSKYKFNDKYFSLGSCKHSDISTFSFHPLKTITTGEGGLITTNKVTLYNKIKSLRSHGITQHPIKHWQYHQNEYGFNFRISDLNCALGLSQLFKLKSFLSRRKKIYDIYLKKLNNYKNIVHIIKKEENTIPSYHLVLFRIDFKKINSTKDLFFKYMKTKKIKLQFHYTPIYKFSLFKALKRNYNFKKTKIYSNNCFSLPIFYKLSDKEIQYIVTMIKNYIENRMGLNEK